MNGQRSVKIEIIVGKMQWDHTPHLAACKLYIHRKITLVDSREVKWIEWKDIKIHENN